MSPHQVQLTRSYMAEPDDTFPWTDLHTP